MGELSDNLKELGYEPTGDESPFDDDGELWTNGTEMVCDETAIVIDSDSPEVSGGDSARERDYFRYEKSNKVKMVGGFIGPYMRADGLYGDES